MIRGHSPEARGKGESGAALVEFALVVGLFVFILYGLISFGMVLATKQQVTNAAADAARAAVGQADDTDAIDAAEARVVAALGAVGTKYTLDPPISVASCGSNQCITVTIVYNLAPSPGLGLVIPPTTTAKSVVQYS